MSTVLAIFRRDGEAVDPEEMDAMLGSLQHRIADGQDVYRQGCVVLAHQHLWITPEEQGERQPLTSDRGRFAISFDGRLDNRQELLDRLGLKGMETADVSDARLVLHAYAAWKEECVPQFLGDFAFVLWDSEACRLLIARDPLGVRQMTYYCDGRRCIVASTAAPILAHPAVTPQINEGKIAEFIIQYEWNQEESFFQNVYFCPPAHYLLVSESGVSKRRYWLPDPERRVHHKRVQGYVDEFRERFYAAVNARLRFSGKPGVLLSSGMDSTSVAAVVHNELARTGRLPAEGLNTYTLTFPTIPGSNEESAVRNYVKQFALNSRFIQADNVQLLDRIPLPFMAPDHLVYVMTFPLTWRLCRQMQQDGVKVFFHGSYGDTLLVKQRYWTEDVARDRSTGLPQELLTRHMQVKAHMYEAKRNLKKWIKPVKHRLSRKPIENDDARRVPHDMGLQSGVAHKTDLAERIHHHPLGEHYQHRADLATVTIMHWDYYVHTASRYRQGLLDLGLDGWDPFLDRQLVEYVLAIPAYIAGHPGLINGKWILREAMRNILPEETRQRPRHRGPIAWTDVWFAGAEGRSLASLLENSLVVQYGYYDPAWIEQRLQAQRREPKYDYDLWRCACLEMWLRSYGPDAKYPDSATSFSAAKPANLEMLAI